MSLPCPHTDSIGVKLRRLILLALLGALLIVSKQALAGLPNVELVTLLIILYVCVFGRYALAPTVVFVVSQMTIYGFGIWTINYIYIWALLVLAALPLRKQRSPLLWAMISGIYGLSFGALCAIPYFFIGGASMAVTYWLSGIKFDFMHCVANFIIALALYKPLLIALQKGKELLKV